METPEIDLHRDNKIFVNGVNATQWKLDDLVYFFKVLKEKAANMDLSPVKCISRRKAIKVLNKAEKIYYQ